MTNSQPENLRLECRHLMIDCGYGYGTHPVLAEAISTKTDRISPQVLSMALTGYRTGPRTIEILERLYNYLNTRRPVELNSNRE